MNEVAPWINRLKDGDWCVRRSAAEALGKVGDARAVPALVEALEDGDRSVRRSAAVALEKIGERHPDPSLRVALPILRRLSRERSSDSGTYHRALQQIESVTASLKDLPLPAAPVEDGSDPGLRRKS